MSMKSLLRSVFVCPGDTEELIQRNYRALNSSGLSFDIPEYLTIWEFTKEFVQAHSHPPNVGTLRSHFKRKGEDLVVDQLERLVAMMPLTKGDFLINLEEKAEDRRQRQWSEILTTAATISTTGLEQGRGKEKTFLQGPIDSAHYVMDATHNIIAPTTGADLSGEVTKDGDKARQEYEDVEADPLSGLGQLAFIEQMDEALKGAKNKELWIHAAFTGGLKSTLALNWVYSQAVIYRHSSLFFSLEMPYKQVRRILYSMHSIHPKFREIRLKLGIQINPEIDVGVPYEHIRDGTLGDWHPEGKHFYLDYVIPDFNGKKVIDHPYFDCDYAKIHIEVADPDKTDFTIIDIKTRAEVIYSKDPYSMIVVDHCGLVAPRKDRRSTTENLNEVLRDLKKLALGFNRGAGMAILGLFQISREGYKSALKSQEKNLKEGGGTRRPVYNLTHLSYANECVVSNTLVNTKKDGLKPIVEVKVGDKVWSSTGWKTVLDFFNQGVKPTWEVKLETGGVLECTGNHWIRVIDVNGEIVWKAVNDIMIDDYVFTHKRKDFNPFPPKLPQKWDDETRHLTRTLSYLLGVYTAKGKPRRNNLTFQFKTKTYDGGPLLEKLRLFCGDNIQVTKSKASTTVEVASRFSTWFLSLAKKHGIPLIVSGSPIPMQASYLRGYFDFRATKLRSGVCCFGLPRTLAQRLQVMLQSFDIESTISGDSKCSLHLRGAASYEAFQTHIGFTRPKHKKALEDLRSRLASNRGMKLPFHGLYNELVDDHCKGRPHLWTESRQSTYYANNERGYCPQVHVESLLQDLDNEGIQDSRIVVLKDVLANWSITRISSVRPTGRLEPMFDLEVSGDHEYQTGPLLSHNCERSADNVTSTWVDDELRLTSNFQIDCLKTRDHSPFPSFLSRVEWHCRRIYTTYENGVSPEEAKKRGDAIEKADRDLDA